MPSWVRTRVPHRPVKALCFHPVSTSNLRLEITLGRAPNGRSASRFLPPHSGCCLRATGRTSRRENHPGNNLPTFPPIPDVSVWLRRGTGWLQKPCSTYRSEGLEDFF